MDLITQFARVEIVPLNSCFKKETAILGMLRLCQEQGKACGLKKIPFAALRLFSSNFQHNEYMFGLGQGLEKNMNNKGEKCNCHPIINIDENEFSEKFFVQ